MSHTPPVPDANQSPYPLQTPPAPPTPPKATKAPRAARSERKERTRPGIAALAGIGAGALAIGALLLLSRDSEKPRTKSKPEKKKGAKSKKA